MTNEPLDVAAFMAHLQDNPRARWRKIGKAWLLILAAVACIALPFVLAKAWAQDEGAAIDARDRAQSAAIEAAQAANDALAEQLAGKANAAEVARALNDERTDRTDNDAIHNSQIEDLQRRVLALEAAEPQPPEPPGPEPLPVPAAFPNTADGLPIMQLGLSFLGYAYLEQPFVNLLKEQGCQWATATMDCAALITAGHVDRATLEPRSVPAGSTMRSGLFRFGSRYYPDYYAGVYVLDWEGEATAKCGFGERATKIEANRIECTYKPNNKDWSNVEFTAIGEGFKNPRLYRIENESAINAGAVFDPKFVAHAKGYKVLRTMDWQDTNTSWVRSVDQLATKQMLGWANTSGLDENKVSLPILPRGTPTEVLFDLAMATDTALWMNVPPYIGAPASLDDNSVPGDGNKLRAIGRTNFAAIMASPEWKKYASEIVRSLKASVYPKSRMLYVELANEVWNQAFPFWRATWYYWGIGEGASQGKGYRYGLGYATANLSVALAEALGDQAYTVVLAGQMADTSTTRQALEGFKAYFSERNIDATPYLARLGVSTASYYHGAFTWGNDKSAGYFPGLTVDQWKAKWLAEIARDPEGLKQRVADFVISGPDTEVGTIPNLIKRRKEHQKITEDAGAVFIGSYESLSHDTSSVIGGWGAQFINWVENWRAGPHGERMTRALIEAEFAQNPNAIIANFNSIGPRDPEGDAANDNMLSPPWVDDMNYIEETGQTKALKPYLRAQ